MQAAEIIRLHLRGVVGERLLHEMAGPGDAGIGDREPKRPEGVERRIDGMLHIEILTDVTAAGEHLSAIERAEFGFRIAELQRIAAHDCDRAAGLDQHARHGKADAARSARDQGRGFGGQGRGHGGLREAWQRFPKVVPGFGIKTLLKEPR